MKDKETTFYVSIDIRSLQKQRIINLKENRDEDMTCRKRRFGSENLFLDDFKETPERATLLDF